MSSGTRHHHHHNDSAVSVPALLKKTEHYDKDERYMATSDLCEVLKRQADSSSGAGGEGGSGSSGSSHHHHHHRMDATQERQICTAVLRLLHDKSNDVQAIAVKTLSVLLTTVQQEQVLEIADSLADQVLDWTKSELRDVYAIGLRTLVKTIPVTMGDRVSQRLVGRLLDGIRTSSSSSSSSNDTSTTTSTKTDDSKEEIVLACLDILTDVLTRFGATALSVARQHEPILQMCLQQLGCRTSAVIRKRAGNTMGCLSVVLSDTLLQRMVEALLAQIDAAEGVGKEGRRKTRSAHLQQKSTTTTETAAGDTRALIRTMCTVSGAVGHRLGQEQIDRILPIFLRFTDPEDAVTGDDEEEEGDDAHSGDQDMDDAQDEAAIALANELRESCFMGFESFVLRCPKEVEPHLESIIQAALAYMSYDPNYSYGIDDDENQDVAMEDDDDQDDYEDDDEDDEYEEEDDEDEDDDDESWKVRRSAIRALKAVVKARKHDPTSLWTAIYPIRKSRKDAVASAIMGRFKEREENCRVEIMDCFTQLLSAMVAAEAAGTMSFGSPDDMETTTTSSSTSSTTPKIDFEGSYAPKLVKACEKILAIKKGNERSKSSALSLLSTLCSAPGGIGGEEAISSVLKHIQVFLSGTADQAALHREGTSKALRLDALTLVHSIMASPSHDPCRVRNSVRETILPQLCQSVQEQWYKVIAQALRALAQVPRIFVQGYPDDYSADDKAKECAEVATLLYTAMEPLLAAHDVDQEIKECALKACAALLSSLAGSLNEPQTSRLLQLLLERLKNETTRITAIKTLSTIAAASGGADISIILAESIASMASFLKLSSRSLKQTSLESLHVVITHHGAAANSDGDDDAKRTELYGAVLSELAQLIVASDLHLTHLSLRVAVSVLKVCPAVGPAVKEHVLEHSLNLSTSSLLQDHALDSLLALWKQIIESNSVEFPELLGLLRERLTADTSKAGIYNLAKCIATITAAATTTTLDATKAFLGEMLQLLEQKEPPADEAALRQVQLALLITGDLGRIVDLSSTFGSDAADRLKVAFVHFFESNSDDLKQAAAYALGNASVGSHSVFLQEIVKRIDEDNKKQQYLLLSALREFIKCSSKGESIAATLSVILPPLEKHCGDEEEGVRTMVSECLGSLTCLQPADMLPKLEALLKSHSAIAAPGGMMADDDATSQQNSRVCWTIATSVKLAIAGKVDPPTLAKAMPVLVELLQQEELSVRTAALLMVYSATHHMPQVLSGLLQDSIMPALFEVAELKLERKVDLGPFTHTVDDALPLRKAALSIFATCLDNLPGSIDMSTFMPVLAKSLGDAEDIQLHAHQVVLSMCSRQPTYLVMAVDDFVAPLEKTMNKKAGQKTGTELERLNDWIKSALRVMMALAKVEGTMNSRKFAEFCQRVQQNSKFTEKLRAIEAER